MVVVIDVGYHYCIAWIVTNDPPPLALLLFGIFSEPDGRRPRVSDDQRERGGEHQQ